MEYRNLVFIAIKAGRRLDPHTAEGYSYENLSRFVERSLENLRMEALDLLQLHCPPTEVYRQDETFQALDRLQDAGKIKNYGVSVEKVEDNVAATEMPPPSEETMERIRGIYDRHIRSEVHHLW